MEDSLAIWRPVGQRPRSGLALGTAGPRKRSATRIGSRRTAREARL